MKELIKFSLRRRFLNKSQITLNVIMFIVIGCAFFADHLISFVNPSMLEPPVIYIKNIDTYTHDFLMNQKQDAFVFKEWKKEKAEGTSAYILDFKDTYRLHSQYPLDAMSKEAIRILLNGAHQQAIIEESKGENLVLSEYIREVEFKNKVINKSVDVSDEKQKIVFMVVTAIYFMMLSFATSAATEVVHEKATKTLELILTSVSAKTHFLSKMIVGWLVILTQCMMSVSYIFFWFLIRNMSDSGYGLLKALKMMHVLPVKEKTFFALLSNIHLEAQFIGKIIMIFLFLFAGILFIQLILVIVSSFISNMEEAGNVQAPFYMILLGVYYLTLSLNTPYHMEEGLGFYLSFLPFFSMLFMPCRLLLTSVGLSEMLLSFLFSLLAIWGIIKVGAPIYQKGVLDYSNKGLLQILKHMRKAKETI